MAIYCPIVNQKVTYQFCQDCDDHICEQAENNKIESNQKENETRQQ